MTAACMASRALAAALLCCTALAAASSARAEEALVLGINEGATDNKGADELRKQYASLARVLARIAGKPVVVEPYVDVGLFRRKFDEGAFHFAFGKSAGTILV